MQDDNHQLNSKTGFLIKRGNYTVPYKTKYDPGSNVWWLEKLDNGSYKKLLWVGGDAALVKEKREEKLSVANLYKTRPLTQWVVGVISLVCFTAYFQKQNSCRLWSLMKEYFPGKLYFKTVIFALITNTNHLQIGLSLNGSSMRHKNSVRELNT